MVNAVFGVAAPPLEPDSPPAMPAIPPAAPAAPAQRIGRDELRALLERGSVVLVEAMAQQQYDAEHLPGAVNVPDELTADIATRLVRTRDTTVVVYCSGPGCTRSKVTAAAFVRLGYCDVYVYPGGKSDWADAGLPFEGTRTAVGA